MFPFLMPNTVVQMMQLGVRSAVMMAEAQAVMAMRIAGMAGLWRVTPAENARMMNEKLDAARDASLAVARAAMSGHSPIAMAEAALKPIRRRTRANAARLTKRGPRRPT